jgi:hypothetical protein
MTRRRSYLWIFATALVAFARPATAQTVTMQMTNLVCPTNPQVLQLTATVAPVFGSPARYNYRYQLTNPAGNTVRVSSFSITTQSSLASLFVNTTPFGWISSTSGPAGQRRISWDWLPGSPSTVMAQLDPGETFEFGFSLNRNGIPNSGSVMTGPDNCWVGTTLGPTADEPPGGVVPEPATLSLLGVGLLPLALLLRRR